MNSRTHHRTPPTPPQYDYHMPDSTALPIARLIARAQVALTYMPADENRTLLSESIREVLGVVVPEPICEALA